MPETKETPAKKPDPFFQKMYEDMGIVIEGGEPKPLKPEKQEEKPIAYPEQLLSIGEMVGDIHRQQEKAKEKKPDEKKEEAKEEKEEVKTEEVKNEEPKPEAKKEEKVEVK